MPGMVLRRCARSGPWKSRSWKASINGLSGLPSSTLQNKAHETLIGGELSANLNNDTENPSSVYVGSWIRFKDAIIPYFGLEFGEIHVGASYDVNTSSLKPASNSRGGVEISLIYIRKYTDPSMKKLNCPKF